MHKNYIFLSPNCVLIINAIRRRILTIILYVDRILWHKQETSISTVTCKQCKLQLEPDLRCAAGKKACGREGGSIGSKTE